MNDPYRQLLNEEKIPWTHAFWVIVWFSFLTFVGLILALFGSIYFYQFSGFTFKLVAFLLGVFVFGGGFLLLVKFTEFWDESLIDIQNTVYFNSDFNKRITFQVLNLDPSQEGDYAAFFTLLHHAMRTQNHSKETELNLGKKPLSIFFDYIATNGVLKIYATLSISKALAFQEAIKRYFPKVKVIRCNDPLEPIKKSYKSGSLDIGDVSGFSMGFTQTNLYPVGPIENSAITQQPIQDLLRNMIFASQNNRTICLQYGFVFGEDGAQKKYQSDFDDHLKDMTSLFDPTIKGKEKSASKLFPDREIVGLNVIYERLNSIWIMSAMRVMAIDKTPGTYTMLERMMKSFIGKSNLPIDIVYLTATRQVYFKYTKDNRQPEPDDVYNNMHYPDPSLETLIAPYYQKYYYPQESLLRRGTILRSIYNRNPMAPWHPKYTQMDPETMKYYFCLGV